MLIFITDQLLNKIVKTFKVLAQFFGIKASSPAPEIEMFLLTFMDSCLQEAFCEQFVEMLRSTISSFVENATDHMHSFLGMNSLIILFNMH